MSEISLFLQVVTSVKSWSINCWLLPSQLLVNELSFRVSKFPRKRRGVKTQTEIVRSKEFCLQTSGTYTTVCSWRDSFVSSLCSLIYDYLVVGI